MKFTESKPEGPHSTEYLNRVLHEGVKAIIKVGIFVGIPAYLIANYILPALTQK